MIKKMLVGIVLLAILVSPNTAMSNGWGPFIGGVLAGVIISNVYNNCYGCGPRWGGGGYVERNRVWIYTLFDAMKYMTCLPVSTYLS